MKVLCLGSINIDKVFQVSHIVAPGETISGSGFSQGLGGKGANQAIALAKAGSSVSLAGKIGEDGEWTLQELQGYGVDTSLVGRNGSGTGQAIIQVARTGQNSIVLFPGANHEIDSDDIDRILAPFESGDVIVLQNEISHVSEILEKAHARDLRICFNPSPFDDALVSYPLDVVDLFVVNEIEGAALARTDDRSSYRSNCELLHARFPHAGILLTAGRDGAYFADSDGLWFSPIVDAPVVDTTAAGDTFLGYFLSALLRGYDRQQALDLASRASALAVSHKGAAASIPMANQVFSDRSVM